MVLLQGPTDWRFLMSEVLLYGRRVVPTDILMDVWLQV